MKRFRRVKLILIVVVLVLLLLVGWHMYVRPKQHAVVIPSAPPVKVIAAHICPQSMPVWAVATGQVMARKQTILQSRQAGYIISIHFAEGEMVHAGQVLISLDDREQRTAVKQNQIAVDQARQTYARNLAASRAGGISREALDQKWVALKNAQTALHQAKIAVHDMQIRAPFTGVVGRSALSVGQYITPQTNLVRLVTDQDLRVVYNLQSQYMGQAKLGQKVEFMVNGKTYSAKASFVGTELDQATQTFAITAAVPAEAARILNPGQYIDVRQQIAVKKNALLVPGLSVQTEIGSYYVFLVRNHKAYQTEVTVGAREAGYVDIVSGISPKDIVVTQGANQLHQGASIEVSRMMNQGCPA